MLAPLLLALLPALQPTLALVDPWQEKFADTPDLSFSGLTTFAHLPGDKCLENPAASFDVGLLGIPFDGAVSFRPGARFGPYGLRSGSRRQRPARGYDMRLQQNPYTDGLSIVDCADVPVSPFDPSLALEQINAAYLSMLHKPVKNPEQFAERNMAKGLDGEYHPRVIALGGDHTIVLPILEAVSEVYGQVAVIHLDSHVDTWAPGAYAGASNPQAGINHGTFFWHAHQRGFIRPNSSIHAGIHTRFTGPQDLSDDVTAGFELIHTAAIDEYGVDWIVARIKERVGGAPVVLSLDVDVLDPAYMPATGTPESGGWTTRELRRILQALHGLNVVAMDVVELAPAYDTNAEISNIAAADVVYEFLAMLSKGVDAPKGKGKANASASASAKSGEGAERAVDEL